MRWDGAEVWDGGDSGTGGPIHIFSRASCFAASAFIIVGEGGGDSGSVRFCGVFAGLGGFGSGLVCFGAVLCRVLLLLMGLPVAVVHRSWGGEYGLQLFGTKGFVFLSLLAMVLWIGLLA